MIQIDSAYIADLIDGDGTVTLPRHHRSEDCLLPGIYESPLSRKQTLKIH